MVPLNFTYPGIRRVYYGDHSVDQVGPILSEIKSRKPLIITNRSVHLEKFYGLLAGKIDGPYDEFYEITQHSPMEEIEHATETFRNKGCDSIITVGGGSVIDAGKVLRYFYDIDIPQIAIPTTLSAAEFSPSAGYTLALEKTGIIDSRLVPAYIILDPAAVAETPQKLWRSTGIRAIDHAVETSILNNENTIAVDFALRSLSILLSSLGSDTVEMRHRCQLAAWYSYFDISDSSLGLSHHIGRIIGSKYGIPHGITSCITLPEVILYYGQKGYPGLRRIAAHLGYFTDDPRKASEFLSALIRNTIFSLGISSRLSDFGIAESDVEYILSKVGGDRGEMRKLLLSMI
ncbi:MAG: iron-containing alcohol dehydrogenase [Thermoplasmataceae archaeon]